MNGSTKDRIGKVVNQLLPTTALDNQIGSAVSLDERLEYFNTPGVSVAVINDFEIDWAQGFGQMESGQPNEVTETTLFQAGSISKPIFALAAMSLVQEGRLDLDEDINTYLTSWQVPSKDNWQPRITLRQLLSHTAGLTVHGFPGYQQSEQIPTVPQLLNGDLPANTPKVEVNILPGLQFRYSGGGTTVAQQLLVDTLGKPFPEIMHGLVLEPLGMTNSTFEQPLADSWSARAATAHPWKGIPLRGKYHIYPEMAAAGLWTTATDLAKVGVELLSVLDGRKDSALLTKATIESMLRPQLEHQSSDVKEFMGLGFGCARMDDGLHFGHGGWDEGFVAKLDLHRENGSGIVVMINSNQGHLLIDEVVRSAAQEYQWPNILPEEKEPVSLSNLDDYDGLYVSENGVQFRIDVGSNCLNLQSGQQPPLPIKSLSETEFSVDILNTGIVFEMDDEEHICALTVSQDGNQIRATRQPPA